MGTQINTNKSFLYKELSYQLQGCFFEIRKEYGPGQKEVIYINLLVECLQDKNIPVDKEKSVKIYSSKTGKIMGSYKPDLIVDDKIIVEVKSSSFTTQKDEKQLYHYLRNSKYEVGYLVNFSTKKLHIKRIIYTNDKKPFLKI
jgi:GxxExxY protein